jgi:hypothetical protein
LLSVLIHFFEHGRWGSLVETAIEGQSLTAEDKLFILMQAGLYLTATRGPAAPEMRICYELAEPLCHSLNRPLLLYVTLAGHWRFSLHTEKLTATMRIAERVCTLAEEQNNPALKVGAYHISAATLYNGVIHNLASPSCAGPLRSAMNNSETDISGLNSCQSFCSDA